MKNIMESAEVFQAYSRIDFSYYGLNQINEEIKRPLSGIEIAVDNATGYGNKKYIELFDAAMSLLKEIIKSKKIIDGDYTADQEMLDELLIAKQKLNENN